MCNEKNYLSVCAHCEKKVCEACKAAHSDVLKREIGRINNQVSVLNSLLELFSTLYNIFVKTFI